MNWVMKNGPAADCVRFDDVQIYRTRQTVIPLRVAATITPHIESMGFRAPASCSANLGGLVLD